MTPEQAKLKQREDAHRRSQQAPRRSSQQAISSEAQSEVTERAPNLYRVPQINVPEDLQGVARLIQAELQKIEASQSVLLSIWQKVKDQYSGHDDIEFKKTIRVNSPADQKIVRIRPDNTHWSYDEWRNNNDYSRDAYMGVAPNTNEFQVNADTGGIGIYAHGADITLVASGTNDSVAASMKANFMRYYYASGTSAQGVWPWGYCPDNPYQEFLTTYIDGAIVSDSARADYMTNDMNLAPINAVYFNYSSVTGVVNGSHYGGACFDVAALHRGYRAQVNYPYNAQVFEVRTHNGDNDTWSSWAIYEPASLTEKRINVELAFFREEVKAEIYAELLALNPGIVIPVVENQPRE